MLKPYAIHQSGDWFTLMDTRNNVVASYPTTSRTKAIRERNFMNRMYAEVVAEAGCAA